MPPQPYHMDTEDGRLLNAYIYDYLVKQSFGDAARALLREANVPTISEDEARRRADAGEPAEDSLTLALDANQDYHSKENRTNGTETSPLGSPKSDGSDLPSADIPINIEGGFLPEWWTMFWNMFAARQGRPSSNSAANFIAHNQVSVILSISLEVLQSKIKAMNELLTEFTALEG